MTLVLYEPTADQYLADIRKCGNPNYVDNNGMPALCTAIDKFRSPSLVQALLREGADVNQQTFVKAGFHFKSFPQRKLWKNYGRKLSPLHIAMVSSQFSIVKLLLDNGADPKAKTSKEIEPLFLICDPYDGKDLKILKLMVQRGSDINVRDHDQTTLLHQAIMATNHDMARYLISSGCDVNDVDENGATPLRFCQGDMRCAKLLLENGACPNAQNLDGNTVYHQVMTSTKSQNDKAEFLQMLQEYNVDPNIRNNQGQTALHLSLEYLDETDEIVESILEYGADTKVTDNLGRTPAFYLGSSCSFSSFKHSLAKLNVFTLNNVLNCGIERDLNGEPLIHVLAKLCWENQDLLSFQRIIACIAQIHHSDVNIRDFQNRTALHLVAAESEWEIAHVLLKHGADINAMDCDGNTPLHVAIHCEGWQMARNLLLWDSPKNHKESDKDETCVCPNEKSFPRRSRSFPNLPWMPDRLSVYENIFCLEDNYSSFSRIKPSRLSGMHIDSFTRDFATPTMSKVISSRINATSLFQTCEEHSVGDFHLAEKCDEEKCLIVKQVFRLVADLVGKCEELDPRMKCNLLLTGSSVEGTKMWLPDEFDFMMELTELKDQCDFKNKANLPEVTVRKECSSYWSDLFTEDCSRLSPAKLKKNIQSLLEKAVRSLNRNSYPNLRINFCLYSLTKDFLQMTKVGVKLSFFWIGEKYKKLLITVDLTPAIPLLLDHVKGEVHERVIGMGLGSVFHVIPHSSERHNLDIIWRVSFSLAELQLIRRMSSKQVSIYKCLKFLRDIHMLNVTEVPSYPLKCCIFDFVFGDGYIEEASFNFNLREVLRRLSVYAKAEFYSPHVLRHFFLIDYRLNFTVFDMRWCLTALDFLGDDQSAVMVNVYKTITTKINM